MAAQDPNDAEYDAPTDAKPNLPEPLISFLSSPCGSCANIVGSDDELDQDDKERPVDIWDEAPPPPPGCLSGCGTSGNVSANPVDVQHEDVTAHTEATADPLSTAYSELEAARAAQQLAQQILTDAERWLVECAAECESVRAMDEVEGTGAAADGAAANGAAANGAAANRAAANGAARTMHTRRSSPTGTPPTAGDARRAAASAAAGAAADTADDDAIYGAESVREVGFTEV